MNSNEIYVAKCKTNVHLVVVSNIHNSNYQTYLS